MMFAGVGDADYHDLIMQYPLAVAARLISMQAISDTSTIVDSTAIAEPIAETDKTLNRGVHFGAEMRESAGQLRNHGKALS